MRISIGADHAGRTLLLAIRGHLNEHQHLVSEFIPEEGLSVDYPGFAVKVVHTILEKTADLGILICGTGHGMVMAANRFKGIRAVNCTHELMARFARSHNNANILCLGSRIVGESLALSIIDGFLNETFTGGRHSRRIEQIDELT